MSKIVLKVADVATKAGIPDIRFKHDSSLQYITDVITSNCKLNAGVESFGNNISSVLSGSGITSEFIKQDIDQIKKPITDEISKALVNIKNIKDRVAKLSATIDKNYKSVLASNPITAIHSQTAFDPSSINRIQWNVIDKLGMSNEMIIDVVHNVNDIQSKEVTQGLIELAGKRLFHMNSDDTTSANLDQEISEQKLKELSRVAFKATANELSKDDFMQAMRIVIEPRHCARFMESTIVLGTTQALPSSVCTKLINFIRILHPIVSALSKNMVELSDENYDKLSRRLEVLNNYMEYAAYVTNYHRAKTFNSSIVIPNMASNEGYYKSSEDIIINPDVENELTAENCTLQDVVCYMERTYKNVLIPAKGITHNVIATATPIIKERIIKDKENLAGKIKNIETTAKRDVIVHALSQESFKLANNVNVNVSDFIKQTVGYSVITNTTVEDILYNVIVGLEHKGTFTETLFKKLNDNYTELFNTQKTITEEDITMHECTVISNVVIDYLFKKFVA